MPAEKDAQLKGDLSLSFTRPVVLTPGSSSFSTYSPTQAARFQDGAPLHSPQSTLTWLEAKRPICELTYLAASEPGNRESANLSREIPQGTVLKLRQSEIRLMQTCRAGEDCFPIVLDVVHVGFHNSLTTDAGVPSLQANDGSIFYVTCRGPDLRIGSLIEALPTGSIQVESCK